MSTDFDFIAEALPAFLSEAEEQVQNLEALLLQLEDQPGDAELLNALFRCAHTVKGSAGLFGLDAVVDFTHHVETLLHKLREGQVLLTPALSTLLLRCNDQIRGLVAEAAAGSPHETDEAGAAERAAIVAELQAAAGVVPDAETAAVVAPPPVSSGALRPWHVSVAFGTEVFRNGMDPLAVLNYVRGLGDVPHMVCDVQGVPPLDEIDAESCHLAFIFGLSTQASREQIEDAFSFVREDCQLHVFSPGATPAQFADLIDAMPGNPRLGEILVAAGAISPVQLQQGLRSQQAAAALGEQALLGSLLTAQTGLAPQVVDAALRKQREQRRGDPAAAAGEDQRFIRVQAHRLDAVINLLGELVIAGAGAELLARQTGQRPLIEANGQISRLIEEIRNGTLQLRMVPIGETFARFRRVVRDTAAELGKTVQLDIVGGDTELDKSVVERIADPLMHLVRNGLDHGLETPAEREAAGKPTQGRLTLSAHHEAGSIVIRITDDGRGIHRRKVLERAWERGLVEPGVVPDDDAILRLIFEPGFSTAAAITNLSGRGVGMDVVRSNIEALRGSVLLESVEGAGSTIEIRLPLTLAIIDGFLVGVGNSRFIFPLDAVVEVIEGRASEAMLDARGRGVVELRGQVLPVVSLRTLYAIGGTQAARGSIVVLKAGHTRFGVLVDVLLGQHQTVIKPLGRLLRCLRGMAGSSILGNGDVALIFDVPALSQLAAEPRRSKPATDPAADRLAS